MKRANTVVLCISGYANLKKSSAAKFSSAILPSFLYCSFSATTFRSWAAFFANFLRGSGHSGEESDGVILVLSLNFPLVVQKTFLTTRDSHYVKGTVENTVFEQRYN